MLTLKEFLNNIAGTVSYKKETQGNCDIITIKDTDILFIGGSLRLAVVKTVSTEVSILIDNIEVGYDYLILGRIKDMDYIRIEL